MKYKMSSILKHIKKKQISSAHKKAIFIVFFLNIIYN